MTHIPMRVRAVIEIDLPRPRALTALVADDRANAIKLQVLTLLHEEAMKAFTAGAGRTAAADFIAAFQQRSSAARQQD